MTDVERGDVVRYDRKSEHRQPFTVTVVYHTGALRLEDPYGYPVVGVDPAAVEVADR